MTTAATEVRKALRESLGISKQALTGRVRRVKDAVPMSPEHALYVVAFNNGMQLDKYLDADELSVVADQVERYRRAAAPAPVSDDQTGNVARNASAPTKDPSPRKVIVKVTGAEFRDIPQLMVPLVSTAELVAERAYPLLHLFENSLRSLITKVMQAEFGEEWWDHVPEVIQEKASRNEVNEGKDQWHTQRGTEPIQYVDLMDLATIIISRTLWPYFKPLFPRKDWVSNLIHEVNVSRRIVAHMNALPAGDVHNLQASFRKWARQLKAKEHLLP